MISIRNDDDWALEDENPDALLADGFEDAVIGRTANHHHPVVAVYDLAKCVQILVDSGMTDEEAEEYLDFNVLGAYVGDNGPLFVRLK